MWRNFYRGDPETHDSGFTVAQGSVAPVRLWSQNRKHDVRMTRIQCQGGSILGDVRREGDRQNRPGGEKRLPPVGELFQVPKLRFWGKNTWNFFVLYDSSSSFLWVQPLGIAVSIFLVLLDTKDETGCISRTSMQTYCINNHNINIFILLQDEKNIKFLYHQMRGRGKDGLGIRLDGNWGKGQAMMDMKQRWETTALVHEQRWCCMDHSSLHHVHRLANSFSPGTNVSCCYSYLSKRRHGWYRPVSGDVALHHLTSHKHIKESILIYINDTLRFSVLWRQCVRDECQHVSGIWCWWLAC